jgi:ferredoxin-NADP reductase
MLQATITSIRQGTPSVKVFTLASESPLEFKAGQWLDLYVELDGDVEVGGYSMTSSPLAGDVVELAIKHSDRNPVSLHMHERAAVGDSVAIDGGYGECYYAGGMAESLVLVAGGIGITPLMSIVRYATTVTPGTAIELLYSATGADEHLFRPELEALNTSNPRLRCEFWVSRAGDSSLPPRTLRGRIADDRLRATLGQRDAMYFVCGPGEMIDQVAQTLASLGVAKDRIRYERWW